LDGSLHGGVTDTVAVLWDVSDILLVVVVVVEILPVSLVPKDTLR
jgi:hypothetical protein